MRTTACLLLAVVLALFSVEQGFTSPSPSDTYLTGTVYYDANTNEYTLKLGVVDTTGAAFGFYNDTIDTTGWGILQIETSSAFQDNVQAYAAGYLEAAMTQPRVVQMYNNLFSFYWPNADTVPSDVAEFFEQQDQWMRDQISLNEDNDYWQAVSIILSQYDGFVAGYQQNDGGAPLNITAFQVLNGAGDLLDLIPALNVSNRVEWHKLSPEEFRIKNALNGHCSALIKVTGDYSDMFMGHSAWFIYSSMLRIFKYYNFNLNSPFVAAKSLAFSSYPGFLESLDDFYMMSSNVVMLQTTNSIFNMDLYDLVVPQSLLAWHRVRVANMISNTGAEWAAAVSNYNSGTYNNQYMVIDTKEFHPGQPLGSNILWVVEQIPGLVESADMSDTLTRGYWPSYNVPYFQNIYNLSGYPDIVEKFGYDNSYQMAPRAQIFRRDQGTVDSWETFHAMMRYNDFENDPYANGNPGYAICSRFDLGSNPVAAGCIDTKITSYTRSQSLFAAAINGPTTGDGNLPPFDWSEFPTTPHYGEPQIYDFSFVAMFPQWPSLSLKQ